MHTLTTVLYFQCEDYEQIVPQCCLAVLDHLIEFLSYFLRVLLLITVSAKQDLQKLDYDTESFFFFLIYGNLLYVRVPLARCTSMSRHCILVAFSFAPV